MRLSTLIFRSGIILATSGMCSARNPSSSNCVAFAEASQHVGTTQCISGAVQSVETAGKGVTYLSFCKDPKACPFTVVVFPADLKKMGDIRQLEGRQIEIKGTIEDYDGRAQIILRRTQQLLGDAAFLLFPRVPTDYDVERAGHNRAGGSTHAKGAKKKHAKQGQPVSIDDPGEP
jgi:DNA/RNA endonuclease YhcR with UshA esterase domain